MKGCLLLSGFSIINALFAFIGKGNAIERECLGDFNIGAFWGPIKEQCVHVHSNYTLKLYKLSRVSRNLILREIGHFLYCYYFLIL